MEVRHGHARLERRGLVGRRRRLQAGPGPLGNRRHAVFGIGFPEETYRFFAVEYDRGTETIRPTEDMEKSSWLRKVRMYEEAPYQDYLKIPDKHAIRNLGLYAEQYDVLKGKIGVLAARDAPGLMAKMFMGCDGCCVGISNIAPELWASFTTFCLDGRYNEARQLFMRSLLPLMQHCWAENANRTITHSASTKEALAQLGIFSSSRVRPPEQDVSATDREEIRFGLEKAGLLHPALRAARA